MVLAPLEQFQILSLINLNIFGVDFSITNFLILNLTTIFSVIFVIFFNCAKNKNLFYIPNSWQHSLELSFRLVFQIVSEILSKENEKYLPFLIILFHFILISNIVGLIPYAFTSTSHVFVTFYLSFSVFIGINIITVKKYGFKSFSLFLPANTSFFLALVLVPIEFVSYFAKPVSLGVRLFINLMAGHTLLKVIAGFSWNLLLLENFTSIFLVIPIVTLIILFGLELGVALIQAYVFIILTCIYIQDGS
jgi:ATP synthase subunit 6